MYDYSYFGCFVYHLHIKKEKKIKKKTTGEKVIRFHCRDITIITKTKFK